MTSPSRSGPLACLSRGCPGLAVVGHTAQPRKLPCGQGNLKDVSAVR